MLTFKKFLVAVFALNLTLLCVPNLAEAQTPQTINYQAVARDTSGAPIANRSIDVVFTIIDSTIVTAIYQETWSGVVTNRFGLFTLQIGRGSTTDDFSAINWNEGNMYLNVNIDGVDMGNATELVSVPYAIYANRSAFADSAGNSLIIDSTALVGTDYIIYTNQGNDTTDLSDLAGGSPGASVDSGSIVGSNLDILRLYQGNDSVDIDVSGFLDNTDNQDLSISGDTLFISGGDSVILPSPVPNLDNDSTNELQDLTLQNDSILIDGGDGVDLSGFLDNTDNQDLSINGDTIFISGGDSVILPPVAANLDNDPTNELDTFDFVGVVQDSLKFVFNTDTVHAVALVDIVGNTTDLDTFIISGAIGGTDIILTRQNAPEVIVDISTLATDLELNQDSTVLALRIASEVSARQADSTTFATHLSNDADTSVLNELDTFDFAGVVGDSLKFVFNGDTVNSVAISDIAVSIWSENGDSVYVLNKKVGIGTDEPQYMFHIQNTSDDSAAYIDADVAANDVKGLIIHATNTTGGAGTISRGMWVRASGGIRNEGIFAFATSPGSSTSGSAIGLRGAALNNLSFLNVGVYGEAGAAENSRGVQGILDTAFTYTTNDAGVYGIGRGQVSGGGDNIGVFGRSNHPNNSGTNYGLYTRAENADTNYAAYFESGAVYVGDSLIIPSGSQNGFVLTSDANGIASWAPSTGIVDSIYANSNGDTLFVVTNSGTSAYKLQDTTISAGSIVGTDLVLEQNTGGNISIDLSSFATDVELNSALDLDSTYLNDSIDQVALDLISDINFVLSELDNDSTYLNDSIDQVAADLAALVSSNIDTVSSMVFENDSTLKLFSGDGDSVEVSLGSLATDAELALEVAGLEAAQDADSTYLNDSIDQVALDLISDINFVLSELDNDSTYLNDSIDQVAADLAALVSSNIDTVSSMVFENDSTLKLFSGDGDSVEVSLGSLATDAELALEVAGLEAAQDADSTYLNDSIDQVALDLISDINFVLSELDNDSTYLNDSIDQVAADLAALVSASIDTVSSMVFENDSTLKLFSGDGDSVEVSLGSLATDAELALEVAGLEAAQDADSTYLNDSIDQVALDLISDINFVLSELDNDSTYLNDSIDQVAADLAALVSASIDTVSSMVFENDSTLKLFSGDGDSVEVSLGSLATDAELALEVAGLEAAQDADSTYLNDSIDQVALDLISDINFVLSELDNDSTYLNDSIDQVAADLAALVSASIDTVSSMVFENDSTLKLFSGDGDSVEVSLGSLATDAELALEVAGLEAAQDADSTYLNDSIDQVALDLISDINFVLSELDNDSTYLNDSIDQVAADLAALVSSNIDTVSSMVFENDSTLKLFSGDGDSVEVSLGSLATDAELALEVAGLEATQDADSTYLNDSIDQVALDLAALSAISSDDQTLSISVGGGQISIEDGNVIQLNDSSAVNELISSGTLSGTDLEIVESGITTTIDISSLATDIELNNELDIDSTYLNDSIDQVAADLASLSLVTSPVDSVYASNDGDSLYVLTNSGLTGYDLIDTLPVIQSIDGQTYVDAGNTNASRITLGFPNTDEIVFDSTHIRPTSTTNNFFIGRQSGQNITSGERNVAFGASAMRDNETASAGVAIGNGALANQVSGNANVAIGERSMEGNDSGINNTAIGSASLAGVSAGDDNVAVGHDAARQITSGSRNTVIGSRAGGGQGDVQRTQDGVVKIGYDVGSNDTLDNRLFIDNSNTAAPLIWGDFNANIMQVGGTFRTNNLSGDTLTYPTADGDSGWVLQTDGAGNLNFQDPAALSAGDNLGNQTLDSNLRTNGFYISNDGDDEGVFINNSGNVGIGTNTPSLPLQIFGRTHINGPFTGTPAGSTNSSGFTFGRETINNLDPVFTISEDANDTVFLNLGAGGFNPIVTWGKGDFYFRNNGAEGDFSGTTRMIINNGGQVGIGATVPDSLLDVFGGARVQSLNINSAYTFPTADGNANYVMTTDGVGTLSFSDVNSLVLSDNDWDTTSTEVFNLTKNIGIGTSGSSSRLAVESTGFLNTSLRSNSSSGTWLTIGNNSTGGRYYQLIGTGATSSQGSGKLLLGYGDTANNVLGASMVIDSNKVGIATDNPEYALDVNDTANIDVLVIGNNTYTLPTTAPTLTGQVITYNGINLVWDTIAIPTLSTDSLSEVLALSSDANQDSILNLGILETSILSADFADIDTLNAERIDFSDSLIGPFAFIDRLDGDTLNMNHISTTTIRGASVVMDTVVGEEYLESSLAAFDSLVIAGTGFPNTSTATLNDVLTYNGGGLEWAPAGTGADNDWDTTATAVFNLTKDIGVGTNTPAGRLDIVNTTKDFSLNITNSNNSTIDKKSVFATVTGGGSGDAYAIYGEANAALGDKYGVYGAGAGAGGTKYGVYGTASGAGTNYAGYFDNGNVFVQNRIGVNVLSPAYELDVAGTAFIDTIITDSLVINNIAFPRPDTASPASFLSIDALGDMNWSPSSTLNDSDWVANGNYLTPTSITDSVAIGNTFATALLDVWGLAWLDSLISFRAEIDTLFSDSLVINGIAFPRPDTSIGNDVLTISPTGDMIWKQPGAISGSDNDWDTTLTGGTIFNLSDTVSIGTTAGAARFNVGSTSDTATAAIVNSNTNAGADNTALILNSSSGNAANNFGLTAITSGASTNNNYGISATSSGAVNQNFGIQASATGNSPTGVSGIGFATTGSTYGVAGLGVAISATDSAFGIHGSAINLLGPAFAGYFEDGAVYIKDSLILPNGAAAGRVLTSDANGVARWDTIPAAQADTCPSGYSEVNSQFCIMETPVQLDDWYDAADSCALDEAKLPSWSEWYQGRTATGVTNYGTVWEWVDQLSQNNASIVGGTGLRSRAADSPESPTNTNYYRCVYYKK